jgi:hypothetical protein
VLVSMQKGPGWDRCKNRNTGRHIQKKQRFD